MDFDRFTVGLLFLRPDAPELAPEAAASLQDAHLGFLAGLHEAGHLLAAGPVAGENERRLRGFTILRLPPDEAARLHERDPAVIAGRFRVETYPWMVPAGALTPGPGHLPQSMREVSGGA